MEHEDYYPSTLSSLHIHVSSSIIHNSQKVEATQVAINWEMDKQNVINIHNGLFFNLKKKGNSDMC